MADDLYRVIDAKLDALVLAHGDLRSDVRSIREDVARLKLVEADHITRIEFTTTVTPLRQIVYGAVAVILLAVMSTLVALALRAPGGPSL